MKQPINEIKRMQELAGVLHINEVKGKTKLTIQEIINLLNTFENKDLKIDIQMDDNGARILFKLVFPNMSEDGAEEDYEGLSNEFVDFVFSHTGGYDEEY